MSYKGYIEQFKTLNTLVIGDVMLDNYEFGTVNRISPEAPVPVVLFSKKKTMLGGSANVALNLKYLGAKVNVCSVIGEDLAGEKIRSVFQSKAINPEGLVTEKDRPTTQKTRVIGNGHQMIRVDQETSKFILKETEQKLIERVKSIVDHNCPDVIIFQDYDKGCLTLELIDKITEIAKSKKILIAVDPKKRNFLNYKAVNLFKPNLKELSDGLNCMIDPLNKENIKRADKYLREKINNEISLITLSGYGIYTSTSDENHLFPAHLRTIADVSGAGDTVISVAALMLALKAPLSQLAGLANLAGGLACEKIGIYSISPKVLSKEADIYLA